MGDKNWSDWRASPELAAVRWRELVRLSQEVGQGDHRLCMPVRIETLVKNYAVEDPWFRSQGLYWDGGQGLKYHVEGLAPDCPREHAMAAFFGCSTGNFWARSIKDCVNMGSLTLHIEKYAK